LDCKEVGVRILIVEDNLDIQANIADYFEAEYRLDFAYNGDQGINLGLENDYDVIVLDIMLPGKDGISVCEILRRESRFQVPILMLTARDTIDDKELGFAAGADDYLVKPFSLRELKMRIEALSKRPKLKNISMLQHLDLSLNMATFFITCDSNSATLNKKEAVILSLLIQAAGHTVTSDMLCDRLWGDDLPESGALRTHMYNLRKTLKKLETQCEIKTERASGYRLLVEDK
jgi:DNA-binding response OmpR family regulator